MKYVPLLAACAALALSACGQNQTQSQTEGQYGAASGENPNLADLQEEGVTRDTQAPISDQGQAYPTQSGESAATTPGAEGGRSSAQTGATDG